ERRHQRSRVGDRPRGVRDLHPVEPEEPLISHVFSYLPASTRSSRTSSATSAGFAYGETTWIAPGAMFTPPPAMPPLANAGVLPCAYAATSRTAGSTCDRGRARGTTISGPASPMTARVGPATTPPLAKKDGITPLIPLVSQDGGVGHEMRPRAPTMESTAEETVERNVLNASLISFTISTPRLNLSI